MLPLTRPPEHATAAMRVAIDATSVPAKPAGAAVYAIELVRAMAEQRGPDGFALYTRGHWFDSLVAGKKNWRIERVRAPTRPARLAWEQLRLPSSLAALGIDVLHSTHHTLPLRGVRCKRVVTVHDVTFLRLPERYPPARRLYMRTMTRFSARAADAIIVPSQAVRDDVRTLLGVLPQKINVVYEAAGAMFAPVPALDAAAIAAGYGVEQPYVLSVGSREPGKNRGRLIRALRALRDEGIDAHLLVVGQDAWMHEAEPALVEGLGMRDRVRFAGYVRWEDLPALYSCATVFAFPSLHEGFGLPVLEAMACGTPVLTSNVSATAEIAGNAALLVDPRSVDAIRDGLRALLARKELREELSRKGRARAAEFSWRRAAEETHEVYRGVVRG